MLFCYLETVFEKLFIYSAHYEDLSSGVSLAKKAGAGDEEG